MPSAGSCQGGSCHAPTMGVAAARMTPTQTRQTFRIIFMASPRSLRICALYGDGSAQGITQKKIDV
jgi:hypothetical protein